MYACPSVLCCQNPALSFCFGRMSGSALQAVPLPSWLLKQKTSSLLKFPLKNEHQHAAVFLAFLDLLDAKLLRSAKFKYLLVLVDVAECSSQLLISWKRFILVMSVILLLPNCSMTVITAHSPYLSH